MIVIGMEHQVNLKLNPENEDQYFSDLLAKVTKSKKKGEYLEITEENLNVFLDPDRIMYLQKGVKFVPQENNQAVQSQT